MLAKWLQDIDDGTQQVIFLDELPWMDTPRSGFITALEGFWNSRLCYRNNVMLIVCGSASSWILNKLINNHDGLYGRVTCEIQLTPFNLAESEAFLKERGVSLSRYDIVQSHMIFGGIPYYLNYLRADLSLAQNVDRLFFHKNGSLRDEYDRLFSSIFTNPDQMKAIVSLLSTRNTGFMRKEICEKLNLSSGEGVTRNLKSLIASDFITEYVPFGMSKKALTYELTDPFCLFYIHFIQNIQYNQNMRKEEPDFWSNLENLPDVASWRGYAFENICFRHTPQIKRALGIEGVQTSQSAWSRRGDDKDGTQIDLLIERGDHIVNMCELKYYSQLFTVNKSYYLTLMHRESLLREMIPKKSAIHQTLITTYGVTHNEYWSVFKKVITMDDLFIF